MKFLLSGLLFLAASASAEKGLDPRVERHLKAFKGENCAVCHGALRDAAPGRAAPAKVWPRRKVVIVGGGIAGLSAAHFLRDLDVLVLEKEDEAGGHARRGHFPNGPYPVAAVYLTKPAGAVQELLSDLKAEPSPILAPAETLSFRGRAIAEFLSDGVEEYPEDVRGQMRRLSESLKAISEKDLTTPLMESDKELIDRYEGVTFHEYLRPFGPMAVSVGDMFIKDMFGVGARDVSALIGLLYIMDMIVPSGYSWPGGLGAASEALARELGPKVKTGAMVLASRQSDSAVEVDFMKGGELHRVSADAVIFATHMMVTRRIAADLSPEKRAAMAKVKYSSYVTVPLSFKEKVWDKSYTLWSTEAVFTDITFCSQNNSRFPGTDKMPGQVAVAYVPLGSGARRKLLELTDERIIARVKEGLDLVLPGAVAKLQEARVIRWGHAMPIMGPGYFTQVQPILVRPEKRYFFAGEDTQIPAFEGAVYSGYNAARAVREYLAAKN